jgi:DNA-binding transcriptional ArsR family regulator
MFSWMPTTFEVLAEPTRRRILDLLRECPRPVNELVDSLQMSQPGVSKHLRVLRDTGLVNVRQDAQRRFYELRPEPLVEVSAWLEPYRLLWAGRLDALERHLKATAAGDEGTAPPSPGAPSSDAEAPASDDNRKEPHE